MEREYVPIEPPRLVVRVRWARMLGVIALATTLLVRSDGRTVAPARVPVATDPEILAFVVQWARNVSLHQQLWYDLNASVRRSMIGPADARLAARYAHVVERAQKEGFIFRPPELKRTTVPTDMHFRSVPGRVLGRHFGFAAAPYILIDGDVADRMNDAHLDCLLGHELGHAIDRQSERVGHPLLASAGEESLEIVADLVAVEVCGVDNWLGFHTIYIAGPG